MNDSIFVNWDGQNVKLTWCPMVYPDDVSLVTSVHGYCFDESGKVMLVFTKERGFNIPGGHLEVGESPEQTFLREAYEEGYVRGEIQYLGMIEVNHEENSHFDPKGKYPMIGYQLFYRMDITECFPFLREYESISRVWVEVSEVPYIINDHEIAIKILKSCIKLKKE